MLKTKSEKEFFVVDEMAIVLRQIEEGEAKWVDGFIYNNEKDVRKEFEQIKKHIEWSEQKGRHLIDLYVDGDIVDTICTDEKWIIWLLDNVYSNVSK